MACRIEVDDSASWGWVVTCIRGAACRTRVIEQARFVGVSGTTGEFELVMWATTLGLRNQDESS